MIKKSWSSETKAFAMSMVKRYPLTINFSDTSRISKISLPDSPMNLLLYMQFVAKILDREVRLSNEQQKLLILSYNSHLTMKLVSNF